jgi:hypothetical protein
LKGITPLDAITEWNYQRLFRKVEASIWWTKSQDLCKRYQHVTVVDAIDEDRQYKKCDDKFVFVLQTKMILQKSAFCRGTNHRDSD